MYQHISSRGHKRSKVHSTVQLELVLHYVPFLKRDVFVEQASLDKSRERRVLPEVRGICRKIEPKGHVTADYDYKADLT